jgi:putative methionine-R-sulfoxide reductase with GAF domain
MTTAAPTNGATPDESRHQLGRFEALTDPDLAQLPPDALVDELLMRIQKALAADTVVLLLLDRGGEQLVARAALGLEEEVTQGFRSPVGRGFAGRIARTGTPFMLRDVGPNDVVNPLLRRRGIRSLLGVPLVTAGRLVGVLHVGSGARHHFADNDVSVLQLAADRIATIVYSQRTIAEQAAARTLQQSLLPTRLPDVEGLEMASRFVAAEEVGVGGDWYDAFRLPDDRIGLVIGDVAGCGLGPAIVMGRLRSSLRAYALESPTPSEALERLARKFEHFEPEEMATVLYLTIAADLEHFTVASLGHLPPVVAVPGRETVLVECEPGPPIGAPRARPCVDRVCELPPGTTVACYTDGLVERRAEPIDRGLERLLLAVQPESAEDACTTVMGELVGRRGVLDDTALVVFRRLS